jgi:hypothetical protein
MLRNALQEKKLTVIIGTGVSFIATISIDANNRKKILPYLT